MRKELQTQIKAMGGRLLLPRGFEQTAVGRYERRTACLEQMVHIFQHRDRFTLRIFWRYLDMPFSTANGYDFASDLDSFIGSPGWFFVDPAVSLEQGVLKVGDAIENNILPFLDKFQDVPAIVSGFERGELSDRIFGLDPLRKKLMEAVCYGLAGRKAKASDLYRDAVDYSAHLDDLSPEEESWVEEARNRLRQIDS